LLDGEPAQGPADVVERKLGERVCLGVAGRPPLGEVLVRDGRSGPPRQPALPVDRGVPGDREDPGPEGVLVAVEALDRADEVQEGVAEDVVDVSDRPCPEEALDRSGRLVVELPPRPPVAGACRREDVAEGVTERDGRPPMDDESRRAYPGSSANMHRRMSAIAPGNGAETWKCPDRIVPNELTLRPIRDPGVSASVPCLPPSSVPSDRGRRNLRAARRRGQAE
jgi:hypothetical protein